MGPRRQQQLHPDGWPVWVIKQPAADSTIRPARKYLEGDTAHHIGKIALVSDSDIAIAALFQQCANGRRREMMQMAGQFENKPVLSEKRRLPASGVGNAEEQLTTWFQQSVNALQRLAWIRYVLDHHPRCGKVERCQLQLDIFKHPCVNFQPEIPRDFSGPNTGFYSRRLPSGFL